MASSVAARRAAADFRREHADVARRLTAEWCAGRKAEVRRALARARRAARADQQAVYQERRGGVAPYRKAHVDYIGEIARAKISIVKQTERMIRRAPC